MTVQPEAETHMIFSATPHTSVSFSDAPTVTTQRWSHRHLARRSPCRACIRAPTHPMVDHRPCETEIT
eukprot:4934981-Pleurochrysis_carterae.AAC.1